MYDVPGVVHIDGNRIEGAAAIVIDANAVEITPPDHERAVAIPRPGRRLVGIATGADLTTVTLHSTGRRDPQAIPLNAITKLEVSKGPSHSRATAIGIGILAGVGGVHGRGLVGVRIVPQPGLPAGASPGLRDRICRWRVGWLASGPGSVGAGARHVDRRPVQRHAIVE